MKESNYYEELSVTTRQLADAFEELAYEKERNEMLAESAEEADELALSLTEANEVLIQQIDFYGESYEELVRLITAFDDPAFNLIDQLLVNSIPSAAIPDYVNVVRRLIRLIYEKGIELKEKTEEEEFGIDEEGTLY